MNNKKAKTVFTPEDEPYLGRETVYAFDQLIIVAMRTNGKIASHSHEIEKNDLQWAACQLVPAGFSLALSIRELVRQGYLYGSLVLLRPLAERAITIYYLHRFPEKVAIWKNGWNYKERPTLSKMFSEIGGDKFPNCGPEMTKIMNSLTHGDPESAMWNLIESEDGSIGHPVSKILNRPDLCDKACLDAAAFMSILLTMALAIFPDIEK